MLRHSIRLVIYYLKYGSVALRALCARKLEAIAATIVSFPLMYKTALGAFEQIDTNLLRVARTLGATEVTIFWRISLPLALPLEHGLAVHYGSKYDIFEHPTTVGVAQLTGCKNFSRVVF